MLVRGQATLGLTPREHELASLISQGMTNQEMADRLNLSVYTVRNEVTTIIGKLQAKNRTHVAFIIGRSHHHSTGVAATA